MISYIAGYIHRTQVHRISVIAVQYWCRYSAIHCHNAVNRAPKRKSDDNRCRRDNHSVRSLELVFDSSASRIDHLWDIFAIEPRLSAVDTTVWQDHNIPPTVKVLYAPGILWCLCPQYVSSPPVFEKTCATSQKNFKSHVFGFCT